MNSESNIEIPKLLAYLIPHRLIQIWTFPNISQEARWGEVHNQKRKGCEMSNLSQPHLNQERNCDKTSFPAISCFKNHK